MTLHRWRAELKTAGTVLLLGMLLLKTVSGTASAGGQPDYTDTDNWAYFGIREDRAVDVFRLSVTRTVKTLMVYSMIPLPESQSS